MVAFDVLIMVMTLVCVSLDVLYQELGRRFFLGLFWGRSVGKVLCLFRALPTPVFSTIHVHNTSLSGSCSFLAANETLIRVSSHLRCICAVHGSRGTSTLLN